VDTGFPKDHAQSKNPERNAIALWRAHSANNALQTQITSLRGVNRWARAAYEFGLK
jgi:hypothetical protein